MTKPEILAKLKETGAITRFHRDDAGHWAKAFELYNKEHPKDQKSPSCGHCFRAVSAWLQS